jgi:hypothetical protein
MHDSHFPGYYFHYMKKTKPARVKRRVLFYLKSSSTMTEEERIKNELIERKIKLWKPPYYGIQGSLEALQALAEELSTNDNPTTTGSSLCMVILESIKRHALDKLREKGKLLEDLNIKILGAPPCLTCLIHGESLTNDVSKSWAEQMKVSTLPSKDGRNNSTVLLFQLCRVNLDLTVGTFSDQLASMSTAVDGIPYSIRLLHGGKTLPESARLSQLFSGKAKLLCLMQKIDNLKASAVTTRSLDEELIHNIRVAATKIQNDAVLEITDGAGNLVSMSKADRLSFLTALGLHAIARQRMQQDDFKSALVFLLQADQEWNLLDKSWQDRVDNYGLLQLDICWVSLKLESIDSLPDMLQRLEQAETTLRKQVHANFVTLALVQAEMNNPIPAVASIFVRLFLLQGIAYCYQQMNDRSENKWRLKSQERLGWAWAFASSLRNTSPPAAVSRLCEAINATPIEARIALRKSGGNMDHAANCIEKDWLTEQIASERRTKQQNFGICENGQDFVDLERLSMLQSLLGTEIDEEVAAGLLRLNNNNVDTSIILYQSGGKNDVLRRIAELDQRQGVSNKRNPVVVDDLALASLLSMGVDNDAANQALTSCDNNVDEALLFLTRDVSSNTNIPNINNQAAIMTPATNQDFRGSSVASNTHGTTWLSQQQAEQDAIQLLRKTLDEVLEQNHSNEHLGASLDDEWNYIELYRQQI